MRNSANILASLLVVSLLAGVAPAAVSFAWQFAPEPGLVGGGPYPTGYSSLDLMMTVDNSIALVELYMEAYDPAAGDFYQHDLGDDEGPVPDQFIALFPDLEYDTYVTLAVDGGIIGAAVDIVPGVRPPTMSDKLLDVAWGVAGGAESGPGTFHVARVTIKDELVGMMDWFLGTCEVYGTETPEPATLTLLLIGGLGMLRRRR